MLVNIDEDLISVGCETSDQPCFKANILARSCLLMEWYFFTQTMAHLYDQTQLCSCLFCLSICITSDILESPAV